MKPRSMLWFVEKQSKRKRDRGVSELVQRWQVSVYKTEGRERIEEMEVVRVGPGVRQRQ